MQTVRQFIRESIVTLRESSGEPVQNDLDVARTVTDTLNQLATADNENVDALMQLLRDNRESIVRDVQASYNRLGGGNYSGDDLALSIAARDEIIDLLKKDADMEGVKYPWRAALWITAYEAGTWDTVSYLKNVTDGSVALLGPLAGPIKSVEKAALDTSKDFLSSASTGTLATTAGVAATAIFAAFNWKLHSKFATWLVNLSEGLPFEAAYEAFAAKTMRDIVNDPNDWGKLFDELELEAATGTSRWTGAWYAFKGAWKNYSFADYKSTLDTAKRAFSKVLTEPDKLLSIPIYDGPPGTATRQLLGYVTVKKSVLTYLPSDLTPVEYIKDATRRILSKTLIGTVSETGSIEKSIDTIMQGQLADASVTGLRSGVDDSTDAIEDVTGNVLPDALGRMMDAADDPATFNDLMASRIANAIDDIRKAAEGGESTTGFTFRPQAGALNVTELPPNFYADVSSVAEIKGLMTAVKEGKASLTAFAKKCAIPLENVTTLGRIFQVWRGVKSGFKISARVAKGLMSAGAGWALINPAWNDNPEGKTTVQAAQYVADAKIRIDAVQAWRMIRSNESFTKDQGRLAVALGGYDPGNAATKWIEADRLLEKLLATQCGGPDEAVAQELITNVIGLYDEYKYYRNNPAAANLTGNEPEPIREFMSRQNARLTEAALRGILREIISNTRR